MARSSDLPFPLSIIKDSSFQAREIRRVIATSLFYLGATTLMVGLFYARVLDSLLEGVAPLLFVSEDMQLAADAVPALGEVLGRWMLAMLAVNVFVTVGLGIYVTRRLGRPILAMKRALREVGNGNLDVQLRESDSEDLGEIADELVAAMTVVRGRVEAAKSGIELLAPVAADAAADAPEDSEARQARGLAECRAALDWFRVEESVDLTGAAQNADQRAG